MRKAVKKTFIITGIVLGSIVALFLLLYAVLGIIKGIAYSESNKLREYVCTIPDIGGGWAPQGVAYSEENDLYILTGYESGNRSVLYTVKNDEAKRVYIADENGDDLKGHAGGVTCAKDFVYIANDAYLHIYSLNALLSATGEERVKRIGVKAVDNNAAYVSSDGERLIVGEFYRAGNYETDESHYYTSPDGKENKATASCYLLNADGSIFGDYPDYVISVPDLVQGFAMSGNTCIVSRSYGLKNSKLEYHLPKLADKSFEVTFKHAPELEKKKVPLYYLDDTSLLKSITLAAFSEDLTLVGDRVAVSNESACNKYIVGKFFGGDKVFSYPIYTEKQ